MKCTFKADRLCRELEEVAEQLFSQVRREQGIFRTGSCVLNGRKVLFLNTRQPLDERIASLAKEIGQCNIEGFYIKPAIRAEIERQVTAPVETALP